MRWRGGMGGNEPGRGDESLERGKQRANTP